MSKIATAEAGRSLEDFLLVDDLFQTVFGNPEFAVYVIRVDAEGEFTFQEANEQVIAIAGRPLSEIRGSRPMDCLPLEVGECLTSNLRVCLERGESITYERGLELPQGQVVFKTSLMPVTPRIGRIRHIVGLTRDITQQASVIAGANHNAALLKALGITLPSAVYLLNIQTREFRFLGGDVNPERRRWRQAAEDESRMGSMQFFHPEDIPRAQAHLEDLAVLDDGEIGTIDFRILSADGEFRHVLNRSTVFSRNAAGEVELVLGVSEDMSEHDRMAQEVRDLSKRMLTLQIDERRQIAQELHDSTGQHLTAARLSLQRAQIGQQGLMGSAKDRAFLVAALDDTRTALEEAQHEVRVLSYLLHPPQIQSQGLSQAISSFATGFGQRAGLEVSVRIAPGADLIDDNVALHLFRICQEALTNVYRHARAGAAMVTLAVDEATIQLEVLDDGIGIDEAHLPTLEQLGVGLSGMRDRLTRLGGSLQLFGGSWGTTLLATVPR
jgi:signal transduction histidine kinase